eukprot:CAMPEP_0206501162 /NCGR_PEP_ID=MMETSP0324_2-20121206/53127_1 /ASSEMBLY_ACC=CAM_ASM_000836 /TAXON_ID=2866 /ORGANISM="Crypthecodinium cohnii, Strain Seligo" /LENGTH=72 /DNA_ID=CAMNT_0053988891 /DNA_START=800 /DNA_END=1019 /DNA_ORIENTATION=-
MSWWLSPNVENDAASRLQLADQAQAVGHLPFAEDFTEDGGAILPKTRRRAAQVESALTLRVQEGGDGGAIPS